MKNLKNETKKVVKQFNANEIKFHTLVSEIISTVSNSKRLNNFEKNGAIEYLLEAFNSYRKNPEQNLHVLSETSSGSIIEFFEES